jgi:hypothetical protein
LINSRSHLPHHNLFQFTSCYESSYFNFIVTMPQLSKPSQNTLSIPNQNPRLGWQSTGSKTRRLQLLFIEIIQIIFDQLMSTINLCLVYRICKLFIESFYFCANLFQIFYIHCCFWTIFAFAVSLVFVTYFSVIFFWVICCYFFLRFE